LFPAASPWPAPLVSDARHALKERTQYASGRAAWVVRRARRSIVRAVYQLPASKDVFLGLENGEVLCYRPGASDLVTVARESGPIWSIGAYGGDEYLAILSQAGPTRACLSIVSPSIGLRMLNYRHLPAEEPAWLCTHVEDRPSDLIGVCSGWTFHLFRGPELVAAQATLDLLSAGDVPVAAVMGPSELSPRQAWLLIFYPGRADWRGDRPMRASSSMVGLPWTPAAAADSPLAHPTLHAAWNGGHPLEVLGLDLQGVIRRTWFHPHSTSDPQTTCAWSGDGARFRAFARLRDNLVAGVTCKAVYWLRLGAAAQAGPQTSIDVANPVAAFALPANGELIVVDADCSLLRVAMS
jgi:hypothetical protein